MSDEKQSRSGFGLSRLREGVSQRTEELVHGQEADVRSMDDATSDDRKGQGSFTFQQEDYDRTEPPKDEMREYWRQFETTPIVRKPITSFASQVTEPGYYIQARDIDEDVLRDLDHWLQSAAIIEGEPGKDFRKLAKKSVIQREVRGTALVEKAPARDDDESIAGLKLINPETMEAVTRPGQSILLEPDDIERFEDAPEAASGGAAAYLQDLSETETLFGTPVKKDLAGEDGYKVGFTRDEVIKLTRDADVGEVFGTSRIEAVSDRIDGIKQKLSDNDEAIASKAYPLWLFMFGSQDNPWDSDDIDEFMRAHEFENFHPGMKQGVRGDVRVDTISGEVADIAESLQFDLDWIISAMPMPKFALGAFDDAVGQVGGIAQQQDVNRQINEARREIEEEFTPLIREIAIQNGVSEDAAEDIYLKIGEPGEPEPEVPRRENIIRYVPKDQRDPAPPQETDGEDDEDDGQSDSDGGLPQSIDDGIIDEEAGQSIGAQLWHTDSELEEFELNTNDRQEQIAQNVFDAFTEARDTVLNRAENQYEDTPAFAVTNFETLANRAIKQSLTGRFSREAEDIIGEAVMEVERELGQETPRFTRGQNVKFYTQDLENSVEDALDEMMRETRIQMRRGAAGDEGWSAIRNRVERKFNDSSLRQRAELIAHMELQNAVETTKLQQWESDPDVIGVRAVNSNASTPLTKSLHGSEVLFEEGDIREQWMSKTREQFLHEGFNPLPPTPPFHFNDTTELEPIYDDEYERDELDEVDESDEDDELSEEEIELEEKRRQEEIRRKKEELLDKLRGE